MRVLSVLNGAARIFTGCLFFSIPLFASAQTHHSSFTPKVTPTIHVTPAEGPVEIDGRLDDAGWQGAARATGFTEVQPGDEVEPPVKTVALITYNGTYLYVGFHAFGDPETIRATFENRDRIYDGDFVGIQLDTYGDAVKAYEFFANPYGIQGDLLFTSTGGRGGGGGDDASFDYIYYSDGRITEDGYVVEMAIPFSSLRFPKAEEHVWRITFARNHPREYRGLYSWATNSRENPCNLCQLGYLTGITGIEPGTQLELLPAMVGSHAGALADADDPAAGFDNGRISIQPSMNVNYGLTPSLLLQGTINPDFSQIAADAAQIDVNSTFALFYPERRPFFQEGSELFDTNINIVYTRAINDPIGAVKATGRAGATNIAFLSAVDLHSPMLLPFEEESELVEAGRSASNILRLQHSLGASSFVGATVTNRRLYGGGGGTVAAFDTGLLLGGRYRVNGQVALSHTQEPEDAALSEQVDAITFADGAHTAAFDGEQFWGYGAVLSIERDMPVWDVEVAYRGFDPAFRTPVGFVTRNAFHMVEAETGLDFIFDNKWIASGGPSIEYSRQYNFEGVRKQDELALHLFGRFIGQTRLFSELSLTRERFRGVVFDYFPGYFAHIGSTPLKWLSVGFRINGGREIYRSDTPELGDELRYGVDAEMKLFNRLILGAEVNYAALRDIETGEAFFSGYVARTRASYQFTRELSMRLIAQYDNFDEALRLEPLLTYRLNPFSIFYVGSSHGYGSFDDPYGWMPTERQVFFKFQYLFQV